MITSTAFSPAQANSIGSTGGHGGTDTLDANVVRAWESGKLSDGTKLNFGRTDHEQGFVVRDDGVFPLDITRSGTQHCADGSERLATSLALDAIRPNAGGHTHPRGREGDVSGLPGPEDGRMALATGNPLMSLARGGAFAIEHSADGFTVRQLAGRPLSHVEQGEIGRAVTSWNQHNGGSGVSCTFVPNR